MPNLKRTVIQTLTLIKPRLILGPTEKVRNASDARRQGEAVYEYCEPRATKQMMYFWLTKCLRVWKIICTGIEKTAVKTLHLIRFKQLLNRLQ